MEGSMVAATLILIKRGAAIAAPSQQQQVTMSRVVRSSYVAATGLLDDVIAARVDAKNFTRAP